MSPAFINRFDVIVLENQIENINEDNLLNLISYLYISFDRIPKKNQIFEKMNKNYNKIFQDPFESGDDEDNNEEEEIEETEDNIITTEKELIEKEKSFLLNIIQKINLLKDNSNNYYRKNTISSISQFCYSIKKLKIN